MSGCTVGAESLLLMMAPCSLSGGSGETPVGSGVDSYTLIGGMGNSSSEEIGCRLVSVVTATSAGLDAKKSFEEREWKWITRSRVWEMLLTHQTQQTPKILFSFRGSDSGIRGQDDSGED